MGYSLQALLKEAEADLEALKAENIELVAAHNIELADTIGFVEQLRSEKVALEEKLWAVETQG
eukprot:scaffold650531_cov47-Prasinocladus_malaysianus.AAC.1